jgi:hypothetical protein
MSPTEIALAVIALAIGIGIGYDAERWERNVNAWSLAGVVFNVIGLAAWLAVRHEEATFRRTSGAPLPPPMLSWLRLRRQARSTTAG